MRQFTTALLGSAALCAIAMGLPAHAAGHAKLQATVAGTYATNIHGEDAAEIAAHHAGTQRLFVINGNDKTVDVIDFADPANMVLIKQIALSAFGKAANSVAVAGDTVLVAVESADKQAKGVLVFMDTDGNAQGTVELGALPDMIAVSPDGRYAVVANEGEPNSDYTNDPEGSVSIVTLADRTVRTVSFASLTREQFGDTAHFPSPAGTSVAQDLEPEYVAISKGSTTAFVAAQENNAMLVVDLEQGAVTNVFGLGLKDWSSLTFDASDKDGALRLKSWPVVSLYQPDAIAAFEANGTTYIVTANEGDAREYEGTPGYVEETRVAKLKLDPAKFPNAAALQAKDQLGRLKTTLAKGDDDGDGMHERIVAFGGRSFSVYTADGTQVFDSGDEFGRILAAQFPAEFNSQGAKNSFDARSDDKGVEPEGVVIGMVGDTRYAFIGLERMGGVMVYDLTDPAAPTFVSYLKSNDPKGDPKKGTAGDVGPEGLVFIDAANSPTGKPMLVVSHEVSGTTTAWELQ